MTTLTPILYADGALRLTDHGPRGGGVVLVETATGKQIDIPAGAYDDPHLGHLANFDGFLDAHTVFEMVSAYVANWRAVHTEPLEPTAFHHFYHD